MLWQQQAFNSQVVKIKTSQCSGESKTNKRERGGCREYLGLGNVTDRHTHRQRNENWEQLSIETLV